MNSLWDYIRQLDDGQWKDPGFRTWVLHHHPGFRIGDQGLGLVTYEWGSLKIHIPLCFHSFLDDVSSPRYNPDAFLGSSMAEQPAVNR